MLAVPTPHPHVDSSQRAAKGQGNDIPVFMWTNALSCNGSQMQACWLQKFLNHDCDSFGKATTWNQTSQNQCHLRKQVWHFLDWQLGLNHVHSRIKEKSVNWMIDFSIAAQKEMVGNIRQVSMSPTKIVETPWNMNWSHFLCMPGKHKEPENMRRHQAEILRHERLCTLSSVWTESNNFPLFCSNLEVNMLQQQQQTRMFCSTQCVFLVCHALANAQHASSFCRNIF